MLVIKTMNRYTPESGHDSNSPVVQLWVEPWGEAIATSDEKLVFQGSSNQFAGILTALATEIADLQRQIADIH